MTERARVVEAIENALMAVDEQGADVALEDYVATVADELADRLIERGLIYGTRDSWYELMDQLDRCYPRDVFIGESGDVGPAIVALLRRIDELRSTPRPQAGA